MNRQEEIDINRSISVSEEDLLSEEERRREKPSFKPGHTDLEARVLRLETKILKTQVRLKQALIQLRLIDRPDDYDGPMLVRTPWKVPRGNYEPDREKYRRRKFEMNAVFTSDSEEYKVSHNKRMRKPIKTLSRF